MPESVHIWRELPGQPFLSCVAAEQEVMEEPVLAADGYSYERSAILQWLQLGHTTSPMTSVPLEHPGLTSNRALRAAIQQWKST